MPYVTPDLRSFESKITSQFGEDGVLIEIARCLGLERGTFFEFGIGPAYLRPLEEGLEGNCVHLKNIGWTGVFLDGGEYPAEYEVKQEFVTPMNINNLYRKHVLPEDLDVMSVDVDGQEFWIWLALQYSPKVFISEYNGAFDMNVSVTMPFNPSHRWNGLNNNNASLLALWKLGRSKNYTLVWSNGVNAIFIRDNLILNQNEFIYENIYVQRVIHPDDPNAVWVEV